MMEDVRGLMERVRTAAVSEGERALSPYSHRENVWSPFASTPCPSEQAAAAAIMAPVFSDGLCYECEGKEPLCQFSFRRWVVSTVVLCVLLASLSMFAALDRSTNLIRKEAIEHCEEAMLEQNKTVEELVDKNVTAASFKATLRSMQEMVEESVKAPAARSVAALEGSMRAARHLKASWDGRTPEERDRLEYRAWVELSRQWGFDAGIGGAENPQRQTEHYAPQAADSLLALFVSGEAAGCEVRRREFSCPGAGEAACRGCTGWCARLAVAALDAPGSVNGSTVMTHWDLENGLWDHRHMSSQESYSRTAVPSLEAQVRQAQAARVAPGTAASVPARRLWSEVYFAERSLQLAFSWTAPIAYCGNYSCFEGAIAAEISLPRVSWDCARKWVKLRKLLASADYEFPIGSANSSLFVVHVAGASEGQQGQLVGSSDAFPVTTRVLAQDASQEVVKATALALLDKFGAWSAPELLYREQLLTFRRSSALEGRFVRCVPPLEHPGERDHPHSHGTECLQVGTLTVELDSQTRWLLVTTLPAAAFNRKAVERARNASRRVAELRESSHASVNEARMTGVGVICIIAAFSISLGFALGCAVTGPLQRLAGLMRRLSELDWGRNSAELHQLRSGGQIALIKDIGELQIAFCSLVRGIEAFTRFVPATVVTRVIRGDRRATRLHVDRRDVTVMFSSIGNFGKVSKKLSDEELLKVIGRYHTVMTHVVEIYGGAVAEILDDGLLVYWNTPDTVVDHALKACDAAMAQQEAMKLLNVELTEHSLPTLNAHIGVHTGNVLSGNIGTDRKMKFGCMGDCVNLASRLNGLCKYYGVGTVVSGATHCALPVGSNLLCRKLDLVRVKGRREPTPIYEVVGRDQPRAEGRAEAVCATSSTRRSLSEQVARVCSRSPAAFGRTSAAGFHVPDLHLRSPGGARLAAHGRSPSVGSRFCLSPTAGTGPVAAGPAGASGPFHLPAAGSEGRGPPACHATRTGGSSRGSGGGSSRGSPGGAEEEALDAIHRKSQRTLSGRMLKVSVPLRLPCLAARGSMPASSLQKQGRRRSLQLPGESSYVGSDASPSPAILGRRSSAPAGGPEPGAYDRSRPGSGATEPGASPVQSLQDCVTPEQRTHARRYEEALHLWQQARFADARDAAGALAEEHPDDLPTQMLYKRASLHVAPDGKETIGLSEAQLRSWTGETRMDDK